MKSASDKEANHGPGNFIRWSAEADLEERLHTALRVLVHWIDRRDNERELATVLGLEWTPAMQDAIREIFEAGARYRELIDEKLQAELGRAA